MVEQAVVSQRAMRHAAWGAKKDIQSKIRSIKKTSPYKAVTRAVHPQEVLPASTQSRPQSRGGHGGSPGKWGRIWPPRTPSTPGGGGAAVATPPAPPANNSTVLATPTGFKKVRETPPHATPTRSKASEQDPTLWKIGEDYGKPIEPLYKGHFECSHFVLR